MKVVLVVRKLSNKVCIMQMDANLTFSFDRLCAVEDRDYRGDECWIQREEGKDEHS